MYLFCHPELGDGRRFVSYFAAFVGSPNIWLAPIVVAALLKGAADAAGDTTLPSFRRTARPGATLSVVDANLALVIVACITVAGALGGIALGALVEGRHRHDDEKRRVYGRLIGVIEATIWDLEHIRELIPVPEAIRDHYLSEVVEPISVVQLVGGQNVTAAAKSAHNAMMDSVTWKPVDGDTDPQIADSWTKVSDATEAGLKAFIDAAQRDMHIGRHWWNRQ